MLGISAYQPTSIELVRLGCLLAVVLPFELAVHLLVQLYSYRISTVDDPDFDAKIQAAILRQIQAVGNNGEETG